MAIYRNIFVLAFIAAASAQTNRPNPILNPNPTNTSNPRLVGKAFPYNAIPEQADTSNGPRGQQTGYNRCNATTAGPTSECQTLIVNNIHDFCIFAPPKPNSTIGDTEQEEVAWCTQATHGARVVPEGTFSGLQFIKTKSYIALTGEIDQTKLNIADGDYGGELDSGGQDTRGNPLGALVYSNNLPSSTNTNTYLQSRTWHLFIGGGQFCFKACDPNAPDALGLCNHVYDRIGCEYNVPAAYENGAFLSCEGEDQDPVGVYYTDGKILTYKQEPEGVTPNPPYTPIIPATSSCQTFQSANLFAVQTSSTSPATPTASPTSASGSSASPSGSPSSSSSGSSASPTGTTKPNAAPASASMSLLAPFVAGAAMLIGAAVLA